MDWSVLIIHPYQVRGGLFGDADAEDVQPVGKDDKEPAAAGMSEETSMSEEIPTATEDTEKENTKATLEDPTAIEKLSCRCETRVARWQWCGSS